MDFVPIILALRTVSYAKIRQLVECVLLDISYIKMRHVQLRTVQITALHVWIILPALSVWSATSYNLMEPVIIVPMDVLNVLMILMVLVKSAYLLSFWSMIHAMKEHLIVYTTQEIMKAAQFVWSVCLGFLILEEVVRLAIRQEYLVVYFAVNSLYVYHPVYKDMCHSISHAYIANKALISTQ